MEISIQNKKKKKKMGNYFHREKKRILILGLDCAGKTTLLNKSRLGEVLYNSHLIFPLYEKIEYRDGIDLLSLELGAEEITKRTYKKYYTNVIALIFVLDSTNPNMNEAQSEFKKLMEEESFFNLPLIFFANKQDMPNALNSKEIIEMFNLKKLVGRDWHIQPSSFYKGKKIIFFFFFI